MLVNHVPVCPWGNRDFCSCEFVRGAYFCWRAQRQASLPHLPCLCGMSHSSQGWVWRAKPSACQQLPHTYGMATSRVACSKTHSKEQS